MVRVHVPARPYELWTDEAASGLVGSTFEAKVERGDRTEKVPVGVGRVVAASVADAGRALTLTLEWPGHLNTS